MFRPANPLAHESYCHRRRRHRALVVPRPTCAERCRRRPNVVGGLLLVCRQRGPGDRHRPSNHSASGNAVGIVFVPRARPVVAVPGFAFASVESARVCVFFAFVPYRFRSRGVSHVCPSCPVGFLSPRHGQCSCIPKLFFLLLSSSSSSIPCCRPSYAHGGYWSWVFVVKESTNINP